MTNKKQPETIEVPIRNVTKEGFPKLREDLLYPNKRVLTETKQIDRVSLINGANRDKYKGKKK